MFSVLTNALLANVNGKMMMNVIHCTPSTLSARIPRIAANHEKASVNKNKIPAIVSQSMSDALLRKPIANPASSMTAFLLQSCCSPDWVMNSDLS